jgi:hypothetical protein
MAIECSPQQAERSFDQLVGKLLDVGRHDDSKRFGALRLIDSSNPWRE